MIKYRVYDTKQSMYLNGEDVDINGYGDLTAYGADEDGSHVTQLLNTRSPRFVIEQYTGLEDKNGVEIAVGDIIECIDKGPEDTEVERGVVSDLTNILDVLYKMGELEVIGNIHENAELLEEEK